MVFFTHFCIHFSSEVDKIYSMQLEEDATFMYGGCSYGFVIMATFCVCYMTYLTIINLLLR